MVDVTEETNKLIGWIIPTSTSNSFRRKIISFIQSIVCEDNNAKLFESGSFPLQTYLPESDLDLVLILPNALAKRDAKSNSKFFDIFHALCHRIEEEPSELETSHYSPMSIRSVEYVNARTKVCHCMVNSVGVDITVNQISALVSASFLEEVDRIIGHSNLFKRSVILVKCWCLHESIKYCGVSLLGSKHGFFSSYSITVLILHLFYCIPNPTAPTPPAATGSATVSYSSVTKTDLCDPALDPYKNIQPLDMLRRFLSVFANFPWSTHVITLAGPVAITTGGSSNRTDAAPSPAYLSFPKRSKLQAQEEEYQHIIKEFNERQYYCSRGMGAAGKKSSRQAQYQSPPFSLRHCNIQDPVDLNNNLGIPISPQALQLITMGLNSGSRHLEYTVSQHSSPATGTSAAPSSAGSSDTPAVQDFPAAAATPASPPTNAQKSAATPAPLTVSTAPTAGVLPLLAVPNTTVVHSKPAPATTIAVQSPSSVVTGARLSFLEEVFSRSFIVYNLKQRQQASAPVGNSNFTAPFTAAPSTTLPFYSRSANNNMKLYPITTKVGENRKNSATAVEQVRSRSNSNSSDQSNTTQSQLFPLVPISPGGSGYSSNGDTGLGAPTPSVIGSGGALNGDLLRLRKAIQTCRIVKICPPSLTFTAAMASLKPASPANKRSILLTMKGSETTIQKKINTIGVRRTVTSSGIAGGKVDASQWSDIEGSDVDTINGVNSDLESIVRADLERSKAQDELTDDDLESNTRNKPVNGEVEKRTILPLTINTSSLSAGRQASPVLSNNSMILATAPPKHSYQSDDEHPENTKSTLQRLPHRRGKRGKRVKAPANVHATSHNDNVYNGKFTKPKAPAVQPAKAKNGSMPMHMKVFGYSVMIKDVSVKGVVAVVLAISGLVLVAMAMGQAIGRFSQITSSTATISTLSNAAVNRTKNNRSVYWNSWMNKPNEKTTLLSNLPPSVKGKSNTGKSVDGVDKKYSHINNDDAVWSDAMEDVDTVLPVGTPKVLTSSPRQHLPPSSTASHRYHGSPFVSNLKTVTEEQRLDQQQQFNHNFQYYQNFPHSHKDAQQDLIDAVEHRRLNRHTDNHYSSGEEEFENLKPPLPVTKQDLDSVPAQTSTETTGKQDFVVHSPTVKPVVKMGRYPTSSTDEAISKTRNALKAERAHMKAMYNRERSGKAATSVDSETSGKDQSVEGRKSDDSQRSCSRREGLWDRSRDSGASPSGGDINARKAGRPTTIPTNASPTPPPTSLSGHHN